MPAGAAKNLKDKMVVLDWWCSDGTYRLIDDTWSTVGMNGSGFLSETADWGADGLAMIGIGNGDTITGGDRRLELFLAACRQKTAICGAAAVGESITGSETMKRTIATTTGGFSEKEKCTWTLRSKTKAPTFVVGGTAAGK